MTSRVSRWSGYLFLILFSLLLTSCRNRTPYPPTLPPVFSATPIQATNQPTATPTQPPPTDTPVPLAAAIDGQPITLDDYQSELVRYQISQGAGTGEPTDAARLAVLDDLINQTLLANGAQQAGFSINEADLQARIDQLANQIGGAQALASWMQSYHYTEESFHAAILREALAAWMRDQIINSVPEAAEQVHARQILLYNEDQANQVYAQLQTGADFATLANTYDPTLGGNLDWFPRGYLSEKAVEDAAFSLNPGEYSTVIQTTIGYHIIQVIERDPERNMTPNVRLVLQEKTLQNWLDERRSQSNIQIFVP